MIRRGNVRRGSNWSEGETTTAIDMWNAGKSTKEISRALGTRTKGATAMRLKSVFASTPQRFTRHFGAALRPTASTWSEAEKARLLELCKEYYGARDVYSRVARIMGRERTEVQRMYYRLRDTSGPVSPQTQDDDTTPRPAYMAAIFDDLARLKRGYAGENER